jgi:hypothetical protein
MEWLGYKIGIAIGMTLGLFLSEQTACRLADWLDSH